MLGHFGRLLEAFPESKLAQRNVILRVHALEFTEPPVVERPFPPDSDIDDILNAAREFARADCAVELETAWDLWQYGESLVPEYEGQEYTDQDYSGEEGSSPTPMVQQIRGTGEEGGDENGLDWRVAPAPVRILCLGPEFDNDEGDHLRIDFGLDSQFLPTPGAENAIAMQQSNLRSLVTLVTEVSQALEVKSRQLWSENGLSFADVLAGAVEEFGPN